MHAAVSVKLNCAYKQTQRINNTKDIFNASSPVSLTVQSVLLLSRPPLEVNLKDGSVAEYEVRCVVAADCL